MNKTFKRLDKTKQRKHNIFHVVIAGCSLWKGKANQQTNENIIKSIENNIKKNN